MSRLVGLDVGGTHVRVATDGATARRERTERAPRTSAVEKHDLPKDYEAFLDAAAAWIGSDVEAVGIGLPGQVVDDRPTWIPNAPWLDHTDLAGDLSLRTGAPVTLANDAQCALLAELDDGAAQDVGDVILVSIGTGIGGAIAHGGRLIVGAHGTAGAFGWLPAPSRRSNGTTEPAPSDATSQQGAWEQRASGSALRRRMDAEGLTPGDALLDAYLDDLAIGLAALASILDPERVLLSGGVTELLAAHMDELGDRMRAHASPVAGATTLRLASHGAAAGARGAVRLAALGAGAFHA